MASAAPPVRYQNVYGIDMPTQQELIATGRDEAEIAKIIGADALVYQDIDAMEKSISDLNPALSQFDTSCFTGQYITGDITPAYLEKLSHTRKKSQDEAGGLLFNMGFAAEDNETNSF
jgi:amidophosphoribosyltransferase